MLYTEETYRPRKYVALLPLIAPFALSFLYAGKDPWAQRWIGWITAGALLLSALLYFLLRAVSIRVENAGLRFRSIGGERLLPWKELQSVALQRTHSGKSTQIELIFVPRADGRPALLNAKLYSRRSLQAIAAAVVSEAPQAELDEDVRGIAGGRFPWYLI